MKKFLCVALTALMLCLPLAACSISRSPSGEVPGGIPGGIPGGNTGGNTGDNTGDDLGTVVTPTSTNAEAAKAAANVVSLPTATEKEYDGSTITEGGVYAVRGSLDKKISIVCDAAVELKFYDVTLSVAKKALEAEGAGDVILTLSGENFIQNTNPDGSNGIDVLGDLLIRGEAGASLTMDVTKNAVTANSITVEGTSLDITAQKDGLHAEIARYDDVAFTGVPGLSYADGGFVHLKDAEVALTTTDDGIQADTFVWVEGETTLTVTTNGGAPTTITEASSDAASGKGVKAGALDYGADKTDLAWDKYFLLIEGGNLTVNANDDAFHSDGEIVISGGTLSIASGDDGIHAEKLLTISDGKIDISRCYEGAEAAKVEILGGELGVVAADDGVNAADGTQAIPGNKNPNCRILISGGKTTVVSSVVSSGDGVDSNGDFIMTGGTLFVTGPSSGDNTALDTDGETRIDGGYLIAVGCSGMMGSSPSNSSKQNVIVYTQNSNLSVSEVYVADMGGTKLLSYTPARAFSNIVVSCPELATGGTFSLHAGTQTLAESIVIASSVTRLGTQSGRPGGFGPGGGWGGPGGKW